MPLSFGVTVLLDPPYQRLIELLVLAEQHGAQPGHGRFVPRSLGAATAVAS